MVSCSPLQRKTQKGKKEFTILQDKDFNLVIIYNFKKSFSNKGFEVLQHLLKSIRKKAKETLQLDIYFFNNSICDKASLGSSINQLSKLKFNIFYENTIQSFQEIHTIKNTFNLVEDSLLDPFMKGLNDAVQYSNSGEVIKSLHYLEETAKTLQLEPNQLKEKCVNILNQLLNPANPLPILNYV